MISLVLSFLLFFICIIVHIILGRKYIKYDRDFKEKSIILFGLGLALYVCFSLIINHSHALIFTGGFLYIISVILHWIYFTSPYLGDRSPSSDILMQVSLKKKMTYREIFNMFNDETLIGKRVNDLLKSGYIVKKGPVYVSTRNGFRLFFLISLYRNFIRRWDKGG